MIVCTTADLVELGVSQRVIDYARTAGHLRPLRRTTGGPGHPCEWPAEEVLLVRRILAISTLLGIRFTEAASAFASLLRATRPGIDIVINHQAVTITITLHDIDALTGHPNASLSDDVCERCLGSGRLYCDDGLGDDCCPHQCRHCDGTGRPNATLP